ncbi:unnamed protein product [Heligmosomoides polygyrus]|uniref:U2A'/phosphoprotein 32 family A C-terminal domain-containing protein n=1 Tax=Heligmosomoides polygyrus TaxID=6339 RepID=A0A3P7TFR0_HELPZ|nr:unnamed protein product [Heligmosomoides polygyrus]
MLDEDQVVPVVEQEPWQCLEEVDFSFNDLKAVDESVHLDLRNNAIETVESVYPLGALPCLEVLHLKGNPIRKVVEYRTRMLEAFGERSCEVKLDGKAPDDREKDTVRLRLALRRAREEKEEKERKRREKIEEKIRYISGDVCGGFTDEVESS